MSQLVNQVPTDAELEILQVLWSHPTESVRFVNERINATRNEEQKVGYTTTLKQMQVMLDKGLLVREIVLRNHLYSPAQSMESTQNLVVKEVAALAFAGNQVSLALSALGSGAQMSIAELEQVKALIQEIENLQNQ
jgi:BlaI family transcriptional regulator, penicillinase repressor